MSTPTLNSTWIVDSPSFEAEAISFTSFNDFRLRSIGCVTRPSMSEGETPIYGVDTITSGIEISGAASLGSET